jgi:hypothetical protein
VGQIYCMVVTCWNVCIIYFISCDCMMNSLQHQSLSLRSSALSHPTTSAMQKHSFNSRSITLSRKENLEIDIKHVHWCEFKSCLGKKKHLTAQRSNSNTVWFNFQTYIIFSINLVSSVTQRSSGTDILYGGHLLKCLYNILYFLWPLSLRSSALSHPTTSAMQKHSFNSRSITLSRKENLEIDIKHVSKRV